MKNPLGRRVGYGCETDLTGSPNTCGTADFLGTFAGDEGSGCGGTNVQFSDLGSIFNRVNMVEDCDGIFNSDPVGIRATLNVPSGIDYDLYLYDGNCNLLTSSTASGSSTEFVQHFVSDNLGSDDSQTYVIEIR